MYVSNAKWTVAIDAVTGKQIWRTPVDFDARHPARRVLRRLQQGRRDLRGQGVPHHARRARRRARPEDRQADLEAEGRRVEGRLFAHRRAARGERRGDHGLLGRGVRRALLPRRLGPGDRQEAVAPLHHRRAGRERPRDVGAARDLSARRREHLDHRLVRSRARSRLLGHRQRRPVDLGEAQGRQPLRRVDTRDHARRPAKSPGTTRSRPTTSGTGIPGRSSSATCA